jgi:hypothetical protein
VLRGCITSISQAFHNGRFRAASLSPPALGYIDWVILDHVVPAGSPCLSSPKHTAVSRVHSRSFHCGCSWSCEVLTQSGAQKSSGRGHSSALSLQTMKIILQKPSTIRIFILALGGCAWRFGWCSMSSSLPVRTGMSCGST